MKTIIITGGAGFIGSNFVKQYSQKNPQDTIIVMDKLTYAGRIENLQELLVENKIKFELVDIFYKDAVEKVLKQYKPDLIVNFAAESHVDNSIKGNDDFINTNIVGVYNFLELIKTYKVEKFLHISTDEVYGSILEGSFNEESNIQPSSLYSASKTSADNLVMAYYKTFGLPVLITRSSNNYGPYQYPEKLMPLFITNLLEGKKVPLYGDGKNVRDWIYVLDNCEAINLVLEEGRIGEVYNIGGGNEIDNTIITKSILEQLGKDESSIEYVADRLGHDRRYSIDCSKIKKELKWKPKMKFKDGLQATIEWYANNQDWWKPLKK